ncbi:tRNA pseudouridine(55) synthase TruB [Cerasicoccus fimbriatus]|uniref:tRNA pseudouridine(55) synthase TruB n=1 Tax=Cerasicoccus fimbriatus TaxID=3014554 RepID=UPI0022B455F7|nr:tRNA pseudouridine(55) synthase TruB [Cerasicoccus sp. TK19100]
MSQSTNEFEGVLLIDKPVGCTSHDVVDRVRRKLKMKKVGHAGTLDPNATGLLIILVGKATKVSQYLMSLDKEYTGVMKLGEITNTYDCEGEVMETRDVPELSSEQVNDVFGEFLGDQYQTPPMFSAKKIDGVPLYKLARKGKEVEREPRFIRISHLDVTEIALPEITFDVACSKGTYIRTLAHDIGEKLGCGAHLKELRRTLSGSFTIAQCTALEKFEELTAVEIRRRLIPVYQAVPSHVL